MDLEGNKFGRGKNLICSLFIVCLSLFIDDANVQDNYIFLEVDFPVALVITLLKFLCSLFIGASRTENFGRFKVSDIANGAQWGVVEVSRAFSRLKDGCCLHPAVLISPDSVSVVFSDFSHSESLCTVLCWMFSVSSFQRIYALKKMASTGGAGDNGRLQASSCGAKAAVSGACGPETKVCSRELGGTRDLINQYRLLPYYEFFCKKSLPVSISETHYLHNVVGDTKIRKGEGMELDQLCTNSDTSQKKPFLCPFDLDVLSEAFHMREVNPVHLSSKGLPNAVPKLENPSRDNERKEKKVKDKDEKYRKQKHRLHRVNDGSCIENIRIRSHDRHPLLLKNQQDKKRRAETSNNDPSVCKR
ncbi:hypothetical protein VNO78_11165 [Psophocarpus tetragonolobus]|uniref:Mediator of RNA polymerase II transcription subunit 19b n=1 Tax=Psophocarpus tetragonolobus TaxID=3891 RepID=A0AAN9XNN6_PSOTE